MKTKDDDIKKALQHNIQRIEEDSFTTSIVAKHLTYKKNIKNCTFLNFLPMIIGLSSVTLGFGFVLLIRQNLYWIKGIGFTESHGLIFLVASIIFLTYNILDELLHPT